MNKDTTNPKDLIGATKPDLALIPQSALVHQALAHKNGADKYGAYNWRDKKVQSMIYLSAALRHITAYIDGEDVAEDSGINHLGHAIAGLNILLDATESNMVVDNRPKKGCGPQVLKRHSQQGDSVFYTIGPSEPLLEALKKKRPKSE